MKKYSSIRAGVSAGAGLAVAALALILFAWLAEEVLKNETVRFDNAVRGFVHENSSAVLTAAMRIFSDIGSPLAVAVFTLGACGLFWIRKRRRDAVALGVVVTGASLLDSVLKLMFHRVRPVPYFHLTAPTSYSFPSGHAMLAFCFYSALAYLLSLRVESRGQRAMIWGFAVLMFGLIGYSRIYLGVHYPTDVIAGYAAGAVWVSVIMLGSRRQLPSM